MSSMEISNLTRNVLKSIFAKGKRFDKRGLLDMKDFELEYGVSNMAEGSARVKLGKTDVVVGIKLSTGEPYPDSLDKGNLAVSGDLLPLASPRFESGPPKFKGIELPRLIDRMVRESGMLDFKKLVIKKGENVWNVFIDIYPINDDGALIDAASIACVAALKNAVFPGIDENGNADYKKRTKNKLPLSKEIVPISFTFYKLDESMIIHPTREEEEACDAKITFGISKWNGQFMVNSCQKGWESTFTKEEIEKIMEILPKKYEEIMKKLNKFLK
ncbi:MAG: exosome complex protein Rrp42 [Nanoarchaeota archaeon]|nr:exosome complex protein Rrp42 [Nanoarchaeota archaeon]